MRKILLVLLTIFSCLSAFSHPLKMAYTSVKYNASKQVFEISHRVFQDDFEATLGEKYDYRNGDVFLKQKDAATQKAVDQFFGKNFSMMANSTNLKLKYIKTEQKNQMGIIVHYETQKVNIAAIKTITIYNFIMMESFKEQVNMFNLNINDEIKRTLKFEIGKTKETLKIK